MSAEPVSAGSAECPLCGAPITAEVARCEACGYHLAGVAGRPGPFPKTMLWLTVMGFLAIYLVTLAVVAFTR